jgi:hypothetical protein
MLVALAATPIPVLRRPGRLAVPAATVIPVLRRPGRLAVPAATANLEAGRTGTVERTDARGAPAVAAAKEMEELAMSVPLALEILT